MGFFKWVAFKFRYNPETKEFQQHRFAGREKGAKKEGHKHEHWWSKTDVKGKHKEGWVGENYERSKKKGK